MKVKFLSVILLLIQNIFGQAEYKMLDAFASGSITDTFISAEFFNYSDTVSEQIAYYFTNKNQWHVLVRDTAGNNYTKFSGQIDTGKTIQKMKLFHYKNGIYLALIGNNSDVTFNLYVVNIMENKTVDSIEVDPSYYVNYNFPYNELEFNSLKVLKANHGNAQILIGYKGIGYGHSAGVDWYSEESKILIFNFSDSLAFSNYFKNSSDFFSNSNISYGYKSAGDSWNGSSSGSEVFSIYHVNDADTITEGENLFSDNSMYSSNYTVISSDDTTNFSHPFVLNNTIFLYGIFLADGHQNWKYYFYDLNWGKITSSANLTVNNTYYVICYVGYKMSIIGRDNGQQM